MKTPFPMLVAALAASAFTACGGGTSPDGGAGGGAPGDGGLFVDFTPPSAAAENNAVLITISGEDFAVGGLGFPPAAGEGPTYFLDGWQLSFDHVVLGVDHLTLSENPDLNPNDPSQTGEPVARADGPWAVDLAKGGPLPAKALNGEAVALTRLTGQNLKSGAPRFSTTSKYAFSYELVTAQAGVYNVNLDADAQAAWREMVTHGWTVWMSGTATWKGDQGTSTCRSADASYDFGRYPKVVRFAFGFTAPVEFKNCENPDLTPEGSRGVQTQASAETVAQLTFHLDHPFWEALEEDAPLRFDAVAARQSVASGAGPDSATVTLDDLASVDFQAFTDAQGMAIPWRTCGPVLPNERTQGRVSYDPVGVPVNPLGGAAGLRGLADYMTYNLSTFGHLNSDGLCFPARKYASPL